jgi:flagellar basal-body rod protein FlgC
MTMFGALHTASSGLTVHRKWLDAVGDNIANINTVRSTDDEAFRARYIVAESVNDDTAGQDGIGNGSRVAGVQFGDAEGRIVYQPDHPLADEQGLVRLPDIDLSDQMTQLLVAQRGYQANLSVIDRARDAYQAALQIGR